ncbi:hypothetical protein BC332_01036 [Capsicum chinense]|nr:hypothetical protein BC332_01036 [Capsicum chinense]
MDNGIVENYQVLQTQDREEVLQVFGNGEPDKIEGEALLLQVMMTLYESLRQYPPLTTLIQNMNEDIVLGELSLPAGTLIALPVILLHHDKEIWGEDASSSAKLELQLEGEDVFLVVVIPTKLRVPFSCSKRGYLSLWSLNE